MNPNQTHLKQSIKVPMVEVTQKFQCCLLHGLLLLTFPLREQLGTSSGWAGTLGGSTTAATRTGGLRASSLLLS